MLFTSFTFVVFLIVVFTIYWMISSHPKLQNFIILVASYLFYGWWDWRFLTLIIASTVVDYFVGLKIYRSTESSLSRLYLWISIVFNLGLLGFFKYFNFFIESTIDLLTIFGMHPNIHTLNIILPVGISFYTFQTMSYSLDISKNKIIPTNDFIAFSAFVSFFPQLVAGPIERASNLLPQFLNKRNFNYGKAVDGCRQILWGLIKKMLIADSVAPYVNDIFQNYQSYDSSTLLIGVFLFAFQIYGDFSGYSDIAIGVAKLFGFDLKMNFNFPYFSKNIGDFWKRWHISLSSWLNDYLFTPLAIEFRNHEKKGIYFALLLTFLISGLWHGAGWNFVVWGGLHGLFYTPLIFGKKRFKSIASSNKHSKGDTTWRDLPKILMTFALVNFTYIFFRSKDLTTALDFIRHIVIYSSNSTNIAEIYSHKIVFIFISIFILFEWIGRTEIYALKYVEKIQSKYLRWTIYSFFIFVLGMFMTTDETPFIYFQF